MIKSKSSHVGGFFLYYGRFYGIIYSVIRMKKVISIFLTLLILLSSFLTVPVFATDTVELKLTDETVYAGDEFELMLFISDNSDLSGAVIDIVYDSQSMEFVSADMGSILDTSASISIKNLEDKSSVRFTYMAPSSSIKSAGVLFSVKFKANETANGESAVKISIPNAGDFVNSGLEKIPYTVKNATVKVINTTYEDIEQSIENSLNETDSVTSEVPDTTESTTYANFSMRDNDDSDNIKLVIGLFVAGAVLIIGVAVYLIVSRKKKG